MHLLTKKKEKNRFSDKKRDNMSKNNTYYKIQYKFILFILLQFYIVKENEQVKP
jgi:hypothetical protein